MRPLRALGAALVLAGSAAGRHLDRHRADRPPPLPPLVTDYANYPGTPQALLTAGLRRHRRHQPGVHRHRRRPVGRPPTWTPCQTAGRRRSVTMTWDDVAPECVGSAIISRRQGRASPVRRGPERRPGHRPQRRLLGRQFLAAGPGTLTFPMPDLARFDLGLRLPARRHRGRPAAGHRPLGLVLHGRHPRCRARGGRPAHDAHLGQQRRLRDSATRRRRPPPTGRRPTTAPTRPRRPRRLLRRAPPPRPGRSPRRRSGRSPPLGPRRGRPWPASSPWASASSCWSPAGVTSSPLADRASPGALPLTVTSPPPASPAAAVVLIALLDRTSSKAMAQVVSPATSGGSCRTLPDGRTST